MTEYKFCTSNIASGNVVVQL